MQEKVSVQNALGNVYYEASYDVAKNYILSDWTGFVTVDEVKKAADAGLDVFLSLQGTCTKMLNSNEKLQGSWDEANEWIANNWMPRALQGGLKYFAHVVSPDVFAQLAAETLEQNFKEAGFTMRTFGNRKEAESWLLAQP
jgi:hypothetical protein